MTNHLSTILLTISALAITGFITGCEGDGQYYEPGCSETYCPPDGVGGSGGSVNITPPPENGGVAGEDEDGDYGGGDGTADCQAVPSWWDLRSYDGCMGSSSLSVLYRGSDHHEQSISGKGFVDTQGERGGQQGSLVYLTTPDTHDCGPIKVATVSNSGSILYAASAPVHFYYLSTELSEEVWMKLHGGAAPTASDYYSAEFGSMLIDIFDCQTGSSCGLASKVGALPPEIVKDNGIGASATVDGAFCGRLFVVMVAK